MTNSEICFFFLNYYLYCWLKSERTSIGGNEWDENVQKRFLVRNLTEVERLYRFSG